MPLSVHDFYHLSSHINRSYALPAQLPAANYGSDIQRYTDPLSRRYYIHPSVHRNQVLSPFHRQVKPHRPYHRGSHQAPPYGTFLSFPQFQEAAWQPVERSYHAPLCVWHPAKQVPQNLLPLSVKGASVSAPHLIPHKNAASAVVHILSICPAPVHNSYTFPFPFLYCCF